MVPKRKVGRSPLRTFSRALLGQRARRRLHHAGLGAGLASLARPLGHARHKAVMARTKAKNRTVEQQAAWEAQQAADAREAAQEAAAAAARRTRRGLRASRDEVDEEFILPVPNTELEEPGNHLTGRRRKTTLVLVVLLATLAIGSRGALWRRERLLWEEYCGKMLRSEFTRMYRMDPSTFTYLVEALSPRIDKNFFQAEHDGGYISPQLRVAMTIRWLSS